MVQRAQRQADLSRVLQTVMDGRQARVWTAMPGILQTYDPAKLTCTVQVAIQEKVRNKQGTWRDEQISVLPDCPVVFCAGGGFALTLPLAAGDEGLVVFASRQIDNWWQSGKSSPRTDLRMHDLSDGFFIPGPFSQPKAKNLTGGASAAAVQLRSLDGQSYLSLGATLEFSLGGGATKMSLDNTAGKVAVTAVNGLWVNGTKVVVP